MLPHYPRVSGAECARALERAGFDVEPHGSQHVIVKRQGVFVTVVPLVEQLPPDQLMVILRLTGLTLGEFVQYLKD
jgi:predicted RNA binding protein YcfA (HicA-like mRNA interferase family)